MRGEEFLYKMALIDPAYVEAADATPMAKSHEKAKTIKRSHKASRVLLIAAVVVMALSVSAFAIWNFGLKDMQGRDEQTLAMNGIKGMAEYEAAREWESRLEKLSADGKNAMPLDTMEDFTPDVYFQCHALSQEAKDELDALLKEYGLRMHESWTEPDSMDALYDVAESRGFMPAVGDNGEFPVGGKYYNDGTFTFNCAATLPDGTNIRYQFYCLTKGTFTRLGYLMANASDFDEWAYTTEEGTDVLLAISANKSIMTANLDNCFVFANILSGTDNNGGHALGAQPVDKSSIEAFAECFDFVAINALSE